MKQAPKDDIKNILFRFWEEMNKWEVSTYNKYISPGCDAEEVRSESRLELQKIYEGFLLEKPAKTGRIAGPDASAFPSYDKELEEVVNITKVFENCCVVHTRKRDANIVDYYVEYQYRFVKKGGQWKIANKKKFSSYKDKWINEVL